MFYLGFIAFVAALVALAWLCARRIKPELWIFDDLAELITILLRSGVHCGFV